MCIRDRLTPTYREFCRSYATGTTNLGLAREDFLSYSLVVPPKEVEVMFDDMIGEIEQQTDTNKKENDQLAATRELLLPSLLSGEVSVANWQET